MAGTSCSHWSVPVAVGLCILFVGLGYNQLPQTNDGRTIVDFSDIASHAQGLQGNSLLDALNQIKQISNDGSLPAQDGIQKISDMLSSPKLADVLNLLKPLPGPAAVEDVKVRQNAHTRDHVTVGLETLYRTRLWGAALRCCSFYAVARRCARVMRNPDSPVSICSLLRVVVSVAVFAVWPSLTAVHSAMCVHGVWCVHAMVCRAAFARFTQVAVASASPLPAAPTEAEVPAVAEATKPAQQGLPPARESWHPVPKKGALRWCSAHEMQSGQGLVPMNGTATQLPPRRYNRGCTAIRSSYKCGSSPQYNAYLAADNLRQVPAAAAEGKCSMFMEQGDYPFPAGTSILFWGNSHLREVVTAIICQFPQAKVRVRGTDQDNVCKEKDYRIKDGRSEVMWEAHYDNNSTVYGVMNCGLMYDRTNAFPSISRILGMNIEGLTHVVANPANVARWAVQTKFAKCTKEPWHQKLTNLTNRDLYEWNPFPQPKMLKDALQEHGFGGKLIWTLPFWCKNRSQVILCAPRAFRVL